MKNDNKKNPQKTPKNITVKNVTSYRATGAILIDTF